MGQTKVICIKYEILLHLTIVPLNRWDNFTMSIMRICTILLLQIGMAHSQFTQSHAVWNFYFDYEERIIMIFKNHRKNDYIFDLDLIMLSYYNLTSLVRHPRDDTLDITTHFCATNLLSSKLPL